MKTARPGPVASSAGRPALHDAQVSLNRGGPGASEHATASALLGILELLCEADEANRQDERDTAYMIELEDSLARVRAVADQLDVEACRRIEDAIDGTDNAPDWSSPAPKCGTVMPGSNMVCDELGNHDGRHRTGALLWDA